MAGGATFNILFVCTGNICRSAFAEVLTRQLLVDRLGLTARRSFAVASAGLHAVAGSGMHPQTRAVLAYWGWPVYEEAGSFVARPLRAHMLRWADVILTAEEAQRAEIRLGAPETTGRLFTALRFVRIGRGLSPDELPPDPVLRARALVLLAARSGEPVRPAQDTIPDPMGRPAAQHLRTADVVFEAVGSLVDLMAPQHW